MNGNYQERLKSLLGEQNNNGNTTVVNKENQKVNNLDVPVNIENNNLTKSENNSIASEKKEESNNQNNEPKTEKTPEQIKAEQEKAKVKAQNKEIEAKQREKLLNETIPSYLKDENPDEPKKEKKIIEKEDTEEYKKIKQEFDFIEKDDLTKTFVQWRKNGGTDINSFVKEIGFVDVNKMNIDELYTEKAKLLGLDENETKEYVADEKDKYESLNKGKQKEIIKELQKEYESSLKNKIGTIYQKNETTQKENQKILKEYKDYAFAELKNKAEDLKEYNGLVIDEKLKQEILNEAPNYTFPVYDEKGKMLGYDVDSGIRHYIMEKFEKQLLKSNYTKGWTDGYDKAMSERRRVSENNTNQNVLIQNEDSLAEARKRYNKEKRGINY